MSSSQNGLLLQYLPLNVDLQTALVALLVFLLVCTLPRRRRHKATEEVCSDGRLTPPPCLPSLPLIGSLPFIIGISDIRDPEFVFFRTLSTFCLKKSKEIGSVFGLYFSSRYVVMINGRKAIHDALVKKAAVFADKKPIFLELHYLNPTVKGLIFNPYDENFQHRRHLAQTILRDLGYGKRDVEVRIQKQVNQFVRAVHEYKSRSFDPMMDLYTSLIGIMLGFLYGRTFDKSHPLPLKITQWAETMASHLFTLEVIPAFRYTPTGREYLKRLMQYHTEMLNITDDLIDECLTSEQEESFVYKYVKIKGVESAHSDELRFILRDLYFGAADTTLSTLRWILQKLTERRELQDKLHEKVDKYYEDLSRLPTLDDIVRLPLVEATILEVLRMETLLAVSATHQTLHDTELHGFFIPEGTSVYVNFHSIHMDPDEWDNPTEFNPERFISEDGKITGKERVVAFGLGKRSCLGEQLARQQMFMMLTNILLHFDICPPEGQTRVKYHRVQSVLTEISDYEVRMIPRRDIDLLRAED